MINIPVNPIFYSIITLLVLFRNTYGLQPNAPTPIDHSLIECVFTKLFTQNVLDWFNQINGGQISPTTEETLFGVTASSLDTTIIRKCNYTALFMRHYIYSSKLNSLAISIQDFISKLLIKYELENFSLIG